MALQLVHITDKGAVRTSNQDSFCARIANFGKQTVAMLAVCDGMGGLQFGELASTGAVRCFENWFDQQLPELMRTDLTEKSIFISWHKMLEQLHQKLCSYAQNNGIQLGTTVSTVLLTQDRLYLVQVGDSRVYLENGTTLLRLTKDQTLAVQEMEAGRLSPEEARTDRRSSILLQCLGGTGKRNGGYTDGSSEKPDRPAPHQRMAQIRRKYLCLPDRFFCGWNRWHDRFGCCGSRFSMDPAQAGKKAEGTDLERVSIKINRLRGMKKC